jgi:hypothetical protein
MGLPGRAYPRRDHRRRHRLRAQRPGRGPQRDRGCDGDAGHPVAPRPYRRGRQGLTGRNKPAAAPQGPVVEGLSSLEVRWILPGQLEPEVAGWFRRFPAEMASREDAYLLDPELGGLSVKIRAGTALEVKVYRGSPGILDVASRARGRIESWRKWSFPFNPPSQDGDLVGWRVIRKKRRITRFRLAGGRAVAAPPGSVSEAACAVELTEIHSGVHAWWSLGFEATGPADLLHSGLQNAAVQIFAQAMPGDVELGMSDCQSYAQWLRRHPRIKGDSAPAPLKTFRRHSSGSRRLRCLGGLSLNNERGYRRDNSENDSTGMNVTPCAGFRPMYHGDSSDNAASRADLFPVDIHFSSHRELTVGSRRAVEQQQGTTASAQRRAASPERVEKALRAGPPLTGRLDAGRVIAVAGARPAGSGCLPCHAVSPLGDQGYRLSSWLARSASRR